MKDICSLRQIKQMRYLYTIIIALLLTSCSGDKSSNTIYLEGSVDGLKVGTLYLQQLQDSVIVNLDSIQIDGNPTFQLKGSIDEPQIMYLYLDKKDATAYNDRISFFATDTTMMVNTTLEQFEKDAEVTGGSNQKYYQEFKQTQEQFAQLNAELLKESLILNNSKEKVPQSKIDSLQNRIDGYMKRKVGYALNFARIHKDKEVGIYALTTEMYDANPKYLDSVFQQMPKKIQSSRYGKQLSEFLKSL